MQGSVFHRIVSNFVIQGGKTPSKDITFADEAAGLALEHNSRYVVQMANRGSSLSALLRLPLSGLCCGAVR